jgi:hypothetical protein
MAPIGLLALRAGGEPSSRAQDDVALEASTTSTVGTVPPTTTTSNVKTEVLGAVVVRTAPSVDPPSTEPAPLPPSRMFLYGPSSGFARDTAITVNSTIDAPELVAAVDYWNRLAGRPVFLLSSTSSLVTVKTGEGICDAGLVACAAPASVVDHAWHPNMDYAFEGCDVYLLPTAVGDWAVIAHELGHCLGFDHVTDWPSVMTPSPHPDPVFDRNLLVSAGYAG